VAAALAQSPAAGLGGTSGLQRAMFAAEVGDVAPSGFLAEGKLDDVCRQIAKTLAEGHDDNIFGVGYAARSAGLRAVVVRARREVAVEPIPSNIPVGGSLAVKGRLLTTLSSPTLYVESPDGQVQQIAIKQQGGSSFEVHLGLRAEGVYTLEIMGKGRAGPEVAWMLGVVVGSPGALQSSGLGGAVAPTADDERAVLEAVNQQRLRAGVPALAEDARLSRIASAYAAELRDLHLFAHVSPRSGDLRARLQRADYSYVRGGENLAQGSTALEAAELAAQSPAHRKNLLDPGYDRCGIGISREAGDVILVELFVLDR
jgi:uncharacterized protein YkwD